MTQVRITQRPQQSPQQSPELSATEATTPAVPTPLPEPAFAARTPLAESLPGEPEPTHLLHFEPLSAAGAGAGAGLDIPCDPQGCVGLDLLGDKLRNDYFFARALIGRLFARPTVRSAMPLMHA